MPRVRYTDRQKQLAVDRYLGGASSLIVQQEFGVSPPSLMQWVREAGHEPRRSGIVGDTADERCLQKDLRDRILEMDAAGDSYEEIAEELGIKPTKVGYFVRKYGRP